MGKPLRLEIGRLTHRGRKRRANEDWLGFHVPTDPRRLAGKGIMFVVADGMGGHRFGRVASRLAGLTAIREYYHDPSRNVSQSLQKALQSANRRLVRAGQRDPAYGGMATTLVTAVVRGDELYVANVGDSRVYLAREGQLWRLSKDHSWVAAEVALGGLSLAEARRHPWRNILTRSIGSRPSVKVDVFWGRVRCGDILLLCSDGLSDKVRDREIGRIMRREAPQRAVNRLVGLANRRGGDDNITIILLRARGMDTQREVVTAPAYRRARARPPAVSRHRATARSPWAPLFQLGGGLAVAAWVVALLLRLFAWSSVS